MEITELVRLCHEQAEISGFYNPPRTFGEDIALIHSEASEALEEHRNGNAPTLLYNSVSGNRVEKPEGIPIELADIVIRVAQVCGYYGIDLDFAIQRKMHYNSQRPYRHGGKTL
jgi:NTP pyrophosphatase (non-canonical NTP hydrolase)